MLKLSILELILALVYHLQKHNHRGELWFIVNGTATINTYGIPGIPD